MTETTPGREPVELLEIIQPLCGNDFGVAPCTASGAAATKCYRTNGTCQDLANYRHRPHDPLGTADVAGTQGDTLTASDFVTTGDLFGYAQVSFASDSPQGVIFEIGGRTLGFYFGVTGTDLVIRIGDGDFGTPNDTAKFTTPVSPYLGLTKTFYFEIDISEEQIALWEWDELERTLDLVGSDTAVNNFTDWTGSGDGAIGQINGATARGESILPWNGDIGQVEFWNSQARPGDMDATFRKNLFFSRGNVADQRVSGAPYILPYLQSVSNSPSKLNLSAANPDASALGNRAVCNVSMMDAPHTDRYVDPYVTDRTWDPLTRSTFWTKWLKRNPYWTQYPMRRYAGYAGQALSAMTKQTYFIQTFDGPNDGGGVSFSGKDVLSLIEDRKVQVPEQSPGLLDAAILAADTSLVAAGASLSDYPAPGVLRIGDEFIAYTTIATVAAGVQISGLTRGYEGTTAADHAADDSVQICVEYDNATIEKVLIDLIQTRGRVPRTLIDREGWADELTDFLSSVQLKTILSEPTGAFELVAEILLQTGLYIWWDERVGKIKLRSVRGVSSLTTPLTDQFNLMRGMSVKLMPRQRISQVWYYYGVRDFTEVTDKPVDYESGIVVADLDSEADRQYGSSSIKKIFSRWIRSNATASSTATRISNRYRDIPRSLTFMMDAKDRSYWIGDDLRLSFPYDVDEYGERVETIWTITQAEEVEPGETVKYVAEDTSAYGIINVILATGSADYPGATADPAAAYIGDNSGLLSDGSASAKVA